MDIHELFLACRRGDKSKVQYLIEEREVEVNVRDSWDSSPLYYACLCGHQELVKYLMDKGARCEANTFDGERCLYGALNKDIRNLLVNYKAVTASTMRRDLYFEFLRRLLERGDYSDIRFIVHGQSFPAHRCLLTARSQYFSEMLKTKWMNRPVVTLTHKLLEPVAFRAMLQYLYTGTLEVHLDDVYSLLRLAKYCLLEDLMQRLEERMTRVTSFASIKPGVNVTMVGLEPGDGDSLLNDHLSQLALHALPPGFCEQEDIDLPFPPEEVNLFPDVIFEVENHQFQCHKAFFCMRSDYFKALLENHFGENTTDDEYQLPVIHMQDFSAAIFVQLLYYIYQDFCELNEQTVFDLLYAADLCLLPGLKRQCAAAIGHCLRVDNVVVVLRTCRLFDLVRLEDQCAEFIAANIEKMVLDEEFAKFVSDDAAGVYEREETDTISIIDDVRFHITNYVQTFSDMDEADEKMALIDNFLEELGLDA